MAPRSTSGRFAPGTSGNPAGRRTKAALDQERADGWINALTGVGDMIRDKSMRTRFESDVVDYDTAMDMWRGDPIAARIVELLPSEATREGYEIVLADEKPASTVNAEVAQGYAAAGIAFAASAMARAAARRDSGEADPHAIESDVEADLQRLNVDENIRAAMCFERSLGGGAILLGVVDHCPSLAEPLDLMQVKSLEWMTTLEARELQPVKWYSDPFSANFGKPEIWRLVPVTSAGGVTTPMVEIHESRMIIFPGVRVTKRPMIGAPSGWGDSVFTRISAILRDFNGSHRSAAVLLSDFAQAVYKIKDLAGTIASDGRGSLVERMTTIDLGRSIARAILVDSEEEFDRKSTPMTGFPETLDRLAALLAAGAEMPLTLLMGQSPGGLNATGASDIRFWYDRVAGIQKRVVTPAVRRIVDILFAVRGLPPGAVDYDVKHKPLWQETDKERVDARLAQAGIDEKYVNLGVYTPDEVATSRFGGDSFSYETKLDFEARAAQAALPPSPMQPVDPNDPNAQVQPQPGPPQPPKAQPKFAFDSAPRWAITGAAYDGDSGCIELNLDDGGPGERLDSAEMVVHYDPDAGVVRFDFDPDQPRDEGGRFSSGSGGGPRNARGPKGGPTRGGGGASSAALIMSGGGVPVKATTSSAAEVRGKFERIAAMDGRAAAVERAKAQLASIAIGAPELRGDDNPQIQGLRAFVAGRDSDPEAIEAKAKHASEQQAKSAAAASRKAWDEKVYPIEGAAMEIDYYLPSDSGAPGSETLKISNGKDSMIIEHATSDVVEATNMADAKKFAKAAGSKVRIRA
jgi:phage-related protein (TIGR01555 family)